MQLNVECWPTYIYLNTLTVASRSSFFNFTKHCGNPHQNDIFLWRGLLLFTLGIKRTSNLLPSYYNQIQKYWYYYTILILYNKHIYKLYIQVVSKYLVSCTTLTRGLFLGSTSLSFSYFTSYHHLTLKLTITTKKIMSISFQFHTSKKYLILLRRKYTMVLRKCRWNGFSTNMSTSN